MLYIQLVDDFAKKIYCKDPVEEEAGDLVNIF